MSFPRRGVSRIGSRLDCLANLSEFCRGIGLGMVRPSRPPVPVAAVADVSLDLVHDCVEPVCQRLRLVRLRDPVGVVPAARLCEHQGRKQLFPEPIHAINAITDTVTDPPACP